MKPLTHDGRCTILRFPAPPRFGEMRPVPPIEKTSRMIETWRAGSPRQVLMSLPLVRFLEPKP